MQTSRHRHAELPDHGQAKYRYPGHYVLKYLPAEAAFNWAARDRLNSLFFTTFSATIIALAKLFLVAGAAGILVRKKILPQNLLTLLSRLTVNLLLPCLIIANITTQFKPASLPYWWLIPLSGVTMIAVGIALAALLFLRSLPEKINMLPLASMQNAGYLVLPLGAILYPQQFDAFGLYCFLYLLGVGPVVWSLGTFLSTSQQTAGFNYKGLLTPPFAANFIAILLVLTDLHAFIPVPVHGAIGFIGKATVPVATFILGGTLGSVILSRLLPWADTLRVLLVKFIFLPVFTILSLHGLELKESYPLLCNLLILQAASPAATAIILQIRAYGGDYQKTGFIMVVSYATCILMLPLWLAVWQLV